MSPARPSHSSSIHVAAYPAFILPFFSPALLPLPLPFLFHAYFTFYPDVDFFSARKIAAETHASAPPTVGPLPRPISQGGRVLSRSGTPATHPGTYLG